MNKVPELSVFFPAYNEEKNLPNTVSKAIEILKNFAAKWEIIIVNDGSSDNTGVVAEKFAEKYKNIRVITHNPNRGYGAAFKSGLYASQYDWITFTDSDGQFDFSEIGNFFIKQKETDADLVIGYYLDRKVSLGKKITSKMWEYVVFLMFGLKVHDIDCGFKLIRKKVVDTISPLESERGAFISSEFLIKAKKAGFKIVELGVHHYPRIAGEGTGRKLNVIIKSFLDLLKLRSKLS